MYCIYRILSYSAHVLSHYIFFFSNSTAPTEIYTLSLHDALPILFSGFSPEISALLKDVKIALPDVVYERAAELDLGDVVVRLFQDRKSTRLNSSHVSISYAVFCLKKKKNENRLLLQGDNGLIGQAIDKIARKQRHDLADNLQNAVRHQCPHAAAVDRLLGSAIQHA